MVRVACFEASTSLKSRASIWFASISGFLEVGFKYRNEQHRLHTLHYTCKKREGVVKIIHHTGDYAFALFGKSNGERGQVYQLSVKDARFFWVNMLEHGFFEPSEDG
jgi:hypothetical protein